VKSKEIAGEEVIKKSQRKKQQIVDTAGLRLNNTAFVDLFVDQAMR
jgi:hypothetical protein